ncbi:hypothetical protein LUW75_17865 [Streptomyces sp. MRC013]|uniref:hypothetical protein n=1 Tax=Streptomyces sp. MRC013 TaxID=2898276 RepID=UPI0020264B93|nr:hypothetical protein [Streptomyces sp. MRC013]URM91534.1 hypothetical protein LUW75_17865 [Streptomyces sp. MRC013]
MRPSIRCALERSAELTRNNQLVEAVAIAEAAINRATEDEHPEIRQWLTDHADDFVGKV